MDKNELKALVSLLDDNDSEILNHVEQKIISIGEEIIPLLEEQWEKSIDKNFQSRIENLIHQLQFEKLKKRLIEWKESNSDDLLYGMYLVSTYHYPELNFLSLKQQIDQLYHQSLTTVKADLHPYDQVRALNQFFFSTNKFQPNKNNFHSPNNSFLNVVLESRKGIPLTLSVIYMLVAKKLGLPVYGVNLPNLFILTYKNPEVQFYINVYNSGLIFTKEDIDNYVKQLNLNPIDIFYQPCSNVEIMKRGLRNLIGSYEHSGMNEKAKEVEELLTAISEPDEII